MFRIQGDFEGSAKGLNVGSSVAFRGVKIGPVKAITLRINAKDGAIHIPVIVEIDPERVELVGGERTGDPRSNMRRLIERGLRAQLASESMVTGQFMIELDYRPELEARLVGEDARYPEIPTVPSTFEKLTKKIIDLPLESLFDKLTTTVEALNKVVASPEILQTVQAIKLGVENAVALIDGLNARIEPLAAKAKEALEIYDRLAKDAGAQIQPLASDVRGAVQDYGKLARKVDEQVEPLGRTVSETLKSANSTLKQAEAAVQKIEKKYSKDSAVAVEVRSALKEPASASRSMKVWADYLERPLKP